MTTILHEDTLTIALDAWELQPPIQLTPLAGGFTSNVWYVDTADRRFVAKYTYDLQSVVEDGLRAAELLADAGVICAAPVRTRTGEISLLVEGPHGRSEPLTLLYLVPGTPFDWKDAAAPTQAGQFLGRIHTLWYQSANRFMPSERIFAFLNAASPELHAQPGLPELIAQTLEKVRQFEAERPVTYGITLGDYIELIHDPKTDTLGVIDFGTVGWGPLLFDVAIMLDMLPQEGAKAAEQRQSFLSAYLATAPMQADELAGLDVYAALHWAQLAKYFAWRLAHTVTLGDPDPDSNARSLAEIRAALEPLL